MNAKPEFSNKTQMYILRVILAGALALMIGMAGAGQTLQAAAQEPDRDSFPGIAITSIPFSDLNVDTTSATSDTEMDPTSIVFGDCNSNQGQVSVWYNFTPTENVNVYVDTIGSDYDTLLAVWKGNPENLTLVACNDDISSVPPFDKTSKTGFFAQAGTTYYIEIIEWTQIASSADPQSFGGILNFHMEEGEFSVTDVYIGDPVTPVGTYTLESGNVRVVKYSVAGGPVEIKSQGEEKIVASMLELRRQDITKDEWTGISQMMGVQAERISDTYVLPRYNGTDPTIYEAVKFANYDTIDTNVTVQIGNTSYGPYPVAPGSDFNFVESVEGGPVVVSSDNGARIIASLYELKRAGTSGRWNDQSQIMGVPWAQLSDTYVFPRYIGNLAGLDASLVFAVP